MTTRNHPIAFATAFSTWLGDGIFGVRFVWQNGPIQTRFRRLSLN